MKNFQLVFVLLTTLTLGVTNAWGAEVTMTAGTNGSACTVNGIDGIKVGTSKAGGDMTITVPEGATSLQLYAAAWKNVNGLSINITPESNVNPTSISLTADDGITSNSPFTLKGNAESFKYEVTLSNITAATTLTLKSSTTKRFVVWGATCTVAEGENPGEGGGEEPTPDPEEPETPGIGNDATMAAGTSGSTCTVNGKEGIKVGTSSKGGDMKITVPAGATMLHVYAAAWKGVTGLSLNITPTSNVTTTSIALTADAGIANSTPFTLSGNEADYLFDIPLQNITTETTLTFTSSIAKRFVVWGATYETAGGDEPGSGETVVSLKQKTNSFDCLF